MISYLIERKLKLSPPVTRNVVVQKDLRVPMRDGVELLADRWLPRSGGDGLPTALIRSPYGRGMFGQMFARPLAERGYQVLIQSVRGPRSIPFHSMRLNGANASSPRSTASTSRCTLPA